MLILVIYHDFPLQSSGIYVDSVIFTEKYAVQCRCGIPDSGKVKEGWKEQGGAEFSPEQSRLLLAGPFSVEKFEGSVLCHIAEDANI